MASVASAKTEEQEETEDPDSIARPTGPIEGPENSELPGSTEQTQHASKRGDGRDCLKTLFRSSRIPLARSCGRSNELSGATMSMKSSSKLQVPGLLGENTSLPRPYRQTGRRYG